MAQINTIQPPAINNTNWMIKPESVSNCPPGLEYLTQLDQIKVEQLPSLVEALIGWEKNNKYVIRNMSGQQAYYAAEDTDTCMRLCCGSQRGFKIHILNNQNQVVMDVKRDFKCCSGCCWCAGCCDCCAHELEIEAPVGVPVGYAKQRGSCWKARIEISDQNRNPLQIVNGPCCILDGACMPCDNNFRIMDLNEEQELGVIKKEYAGFIREAFTTADNFSITFPTNINAANKGTLLGTLFLIVNI